MQAYGLFFRNSTYIAGRDTLRNNQYGNNGWVYWRINKERLTFQILIAVILTGGFVVLLGGKRN
jgi:hypothetical protein